MSAIFQKLGYKQSSLPEEGKTALEKEYDRYNHAHEFYFSLSLQAVVFFYAIVGGVLSISFGGGGKANPAVIKILLAVPIVMSAFLGFVFLRGAQLWHDVTKHICVIATMLRIIRVPNVELLTHLLLGFGVLFFLVFLGLVWLALHLRPLMVAP